MKRLTFATIAILLTIAPLCAQPVETVPPPEAETPPEVDVMLAPLPDEPPPENVVRPAPTNTGNTGTTAGSSPVPVMALRDWPLLAREILDEHQTLLALPDRAGQRLSPAEAAQKAAESQLRLTQTLIEQNQYLIQQNQRIIVLLEQVAKK